MSQHQRIFIIGHSGAGKGILAQGIAQALGWQFIDADFSLASSIGCSLTEILGEQGEACFQECLSDILLNQINKQNIVVTTDDSIIHSDKNRQLLAKEFTIYLKVSVPVQLERISHNRPLLHIDHYQEFLEQLHHACDTGYEKIASMVLNSDENALEEHVQRVVQTIRK